VANRRERLPTRGNRIPPRSTATVRFFSRAAAWRSVGEDALQDTFYSRGVVVEHVLSSDARQAVHRKGFSKIVVLEQTKDGGRKLRGFRWRSQKSRLAAGEDLGNPAVVVPITGRP